MAKLIFILEDNIDLRELYELILEEEDYEILAFATVAEFRQHAAEIPDLYLLDVMLPDGDGIQLCKELNEHPSTAHVPIIMVSAHSDVSTVRVECPRAEFVPKPFDINYLTERISLNLSPKAS